MARIIKTRKIRRIQWGSIVTLFAVFALMFYFVTVIFVRSEHQRVVREIESKKLEIAEITAVNQDLARQLNELSDYSRVVGLAQEGGLEFNHDNRFYVRGE